MRYRFKCQLVMGLIASYTVFDREPDHYQVMNMGWDGDTPLGVALRHRFGLGFQFLELWKYTGCAIA